MLKGVSDIPASMEISGSNAGDGQRKDKKMHVMNGGLGFALGMEKTFKQIDDDFAAWVMLTISTIGNVILILLPC